MQTAQSKTRKAPSAAQQAATAAIMLKSRMADRSHFFVEEPSAAYPNRFWIRARNSGGGYGLFSTLEEAQARADLLNAKEIAAIHAYVYGSAA